MIRIIEWLGFERQFVDFWGNIEIFAVGIFVTYQRGSSALFANLPIIPKDIWEGFVLVLFFSFFCHPVGKDASCSAKHDGGELYRSPSIHTHQIHNQNALRGQCVTFTFHSTPYEEVYDSHIPKYGKKNYWKMTIRNFKVLQHVQELVPQRILSDLKKIEIEKNNTLQIMQSGS